MADALKSISKGDGTAKGYIVHLAEGRAGNLRPNGKEVDGYSKKEFVELMNRLKKLMEDESDVSSEDIQKLHLNLIHACGVDIKARKDDYNFLKDNKIGLIWSPVSNLLLYEDTPAFYESIENGDILLGLGSDWSPSGSKHVWDECKFAYDYLRARLEGADTNILKEDVLKMVTLNASKLIGSDKIGNIKKGGYADFFVLKSNESVDADLSKALDTFFNVTDANVQFVMIAGNLIYGERSYFERFETAGAIVPCDDDSGLQNKMVYLPAELGGGSDFNLKEKLDELDNELLGVRSKFRSSEDSTYRGIIEDLKNRFCGAK